MTRHSDWSAAEASAQSNEKGPDILEKRPARPKRIPLFAMRWQVVPLWNVRTPVLYRYMDPRYVEDFFDSGKLRISSFAQFAQHKDEERQDVKEGQLITMAHTSDDKWHVFFGAIGRSCYIFCGTRHHNVDNLRRFGGGGFKILDTQSFGAIVADRIPNFVAGTEGDCQYGSAPAWWSGDVPIASSSGTLPDGSESMEHVFQIASHVAEDDPLFFKDKRYEHQAEYRLAWRTNARVEGYIDIEIPEARQYCERLAPGAPPR